MREIKSTEMELRPYSTKELAAIYKVTTKTFNKWLIKFDGELGEKSGRFYTIKQVKVIFEKLGLPGIIE